LLVQEPGVCFLAGVRCSIDGVAENRMTNYPDVAAIDQRFGGSIPEIYDTLMVPLVFEPYAQDLARRAASFNPADILETAAGTGAVTRALAIAISANIVATDLNPEMLERAQAAGVSRPVRWQRADAMQLPFADGAFDVIVCQFGAMFFPDKPHAFGEMRRVLRPGGALVFNVWDRIENNAFANAVIEALAQVFPDNPPTFLARVPHGYFDTAILASDLHKGGFVESDIAIDSLSLRSQAISPRIAATAFCQGTPLRYEIESHGADALQRATDACASALAARFGAQSIEGTMRAHVVVARAPQFA
jgi:SAM-dependent methyltransferase